MNLPIRVRTYCGPLSGQLCQCAACGQTFGGLSGFDRHRIGSYAEPGQWQGKRRCMSAAEIETAGLAQDAKGIWRLPKPARFAVAEGISATRASLPATGVAARVSHFQSGECHASVSAMP